MALRIPDNPGVALAPSPDGRHADPEAREQAWLRPPSGPPPLAAPDVLWLLVAVLASLALRIPFFTVPMIHDEGGYAYAARGWFEGTGQLYHDLWISRPQGIFLVYGAVFELLGDGVLALRFAAWVFAALSIVAIWLFARRWSTPTVANVAAVIAGVLLSLPHLEAFTANAEIFMGMPVAFSAFWLLRQYQEGWSHWQVIGVGVLIGIATQLKPSGVTMTAVAVAFLLLAVDFPRRARLRLCADVGLGLALVALPTFVHGWFLGWREFIYATITYRLTQQSSATVGIGHHIDALRGLFSSRAALAMVLLVLLILGLRHRVVLAERARWRALPRQVRDVSAHAPAALFSYHPVPPFRLFRPQDGAGMLIRLWALGALGGIALGGDWWTHYLIQGVPPLALWLAYNVVLISHTLRRSLRWLFQVAVAGLLLVSFTVLIGSRDGIAQRLFNYPGYPAQEEIARYLSEHSDPDRTIYVAFDQAAIYYLADRRPAYRHLYEQELRAIPSAYAEIIAIIRSPDRPQYLVTTREPGSFADDSRAFWREVGLYYEVETTIGGVPIYREKPASELPPT